MMLLSCFQEEFLEAGCDEAGRGCLAGPVFSAAVILPKTFKNKILLGLFYGGSRTAAHFGTKLS